MDYLCGDINPLITQTVRKLLFLLVPAMLAASCAQEIEFADPEMKTDAPEAASDASQTFTRSLDGAVYNEVVDAWMIPQADPYTLANFQAAYDKLAAGKSVQTLSKAQSAEFAPAKKLAPTHYALKIYPRNEEEQWRVEMMEDVQVAYIPFDWVQLSHDEVEKHPASKTLARSAANTFPEKSPYTVTYDYTESTDGGPTGPQTFQLPILYTVWPVGKPLPDDLEYVIDYEIFLPRTATQTKSAESLMALELEAVSAARGISLSQEKLATRAITRPIEATFRGYLMTYDNTLNKNVPLAGLKVQHHSGSNIMETSTNTDGMYTITRISPISAIDEMLTIVYQDPSMGRWKILPGTSTAAPYTVVTRAPSSDLQVMSLLSSARQENEIHRAVNYFYNVQNVFTKPYRQGGMIMVANNVSESAGETARARFTIHGGSTLDTEFQIFNRGPGDTHGRVIGATLHELGHAAHAYANGGGTNNFSYFSSIHPFLRESFGNYSGWYLGEEYYKSLGWAQNSALDITGTGFQNWTKTTHTYRPDQGWYSPLFVDLTDNHNQGRNNIDLPYDDIQGVPPSVVWNIITTSQDWTQCLSKLQGYVGTYYTSLQFNQWIDDYNEWVNSYYHII